LVRSEIRFVNRQEGAGTRVWLEAQLARLGIRAVEIQGYEDEALTHSEVARRVAKGRADVAVGIEAAALAYGLDFLPLTTESYDLVIPGELWVRRTVQALYNLLQTEAIRGEIAGLGGYDVSNTGAISWVE
jgi:putative molybdopterin biosynthesis protein